MPRPGTGESGGFDQRARYVGEAGPERLEGEIHVLEHERDDDNPGRVVEIETEAPGTGHNEPKCDDRPRCRHRHGEDPFRDFQTQGGARKGRQRTETDGQDQHGAQAPVNQASLKRDGCLRKLKYHVMIAPRARFAQTCEAGLLEATRLHDRRKKERRKRQYPQHQLRTPVHPLKQSHGTGTLTALGTSCGLSGKSREFLFISLHPGGGEQKRHHQNEEQDRKRGRLGDSLLSFNLDRLIDFVSQRIDVLGCADPRGNRKGGDI